MLIAETFNKSLDENSNQSYLAMVKRVIDVL